MDGDSVLLETPEMFLQALRENIEAKEGIGAEVTAILTTHILKAVTTQNAVTQAKEAIIELAVERATSQKVEVLNA